MKKACLYVREDLSGMGTAFFDQADMQGMKSDTYMYKDLKEFLFTKGLELEVQSINKPEDSEVIICLNETKYFKRYKRREKNQHIFLILTEPPVYNLEDWAEERHVFFDKVFTYDPKLVERDPEKYIHIYFPINFFSNPSASIPGLSDFQNKILASLIAGAFTITKPALKNNSLLFERFKVLKWYNQNDPDMLHFYARVHPIKRFEHFRGASILNKFIPHLTKRIAKFLFERMIAGVYKGAIPALLKNEVMGRYRFNYCLENSHSINGLISEKIFDCFYAGTVPVYYGAPDIADHIPGNCFILYSDFKNLRGLNDFLKQMNYDTYVKYLVNAANFLNSPKADVFRTTHFTKKIYSAIES
jgi:hypothetical protein